MIIVRIWDGLGNQLFQYAYARSLKARGYEVRLDVDKAYDQAFSCANNHSKRTNMLEKFNITLDSIDVEKLQGYRYLSKKGSADRLIYLFAERGMWPYAFYEEEIQGFSNKSYYPARSVYIKGWFQNEEYFKNIREILLDELTLKPELNVNNAFVDEFNLRECVSIHVRRGDYLKIGQALNNVYYDRAVKRIKEEVRNPLFFVFSDDIKWVRENMKFDGDCIFVNENGDFQDCQELMVMSKCHHNIIANSTFSWWGAWLNDNKGKVVIAPAKWGAGQKGIVPKDWIIV